MVLLETDTQKFDRYSFVDRRQDLARGFLFVCLFVFKFARDGRVRPSEEPWCMQTLTYTLECCAEENRPSKLKCPCSVIYRVKDFNQFFVIHFGNIHNRDHRFIRSVMEQKNLHKTDGQKTLCEGKIKSSMTFFPDEGSKNKANAEFRRWKKGPHDFLGPSKPKSNFTEKNPVSWKIQNTA